MKKIFKDKNFSFIVLSFIILYLFRVYHLDVDVLNFNTAQVQPIDELYYNEIALYLYHHGWNTLLTGVLSDITLANAKLLVLPNIFTAFCLDIFGNNYYGLRMSYLCEGLLLGVLLLAIIRKLTNNNRLMTIMVGLLFICDFNLICLTRSATTVVPCMLALLCFTIILIYPIGYKIKYFMLGFFPIATFMLVYGNMPFVIGFTALYVLFYFVKNRKTVPIFFYLIGVFVALIIVEGIDYILYRQHFWDIFKDNMSAHSNKITTYGGISMLISILKNLLAFPFSNMFRYNVVPLFILLSSIPLAYRKICKENDNIIPILLGLLLMHYCQTIFVNNMTYSKASLSYIIILLYISYIYNELSNSYREKYKKWIIISGCIVVAIMTFSNEKVRAFDVSNRVTLYVMSICAIISFLIIKKELFRNIFMIGFCLFPMFLFTYYTIVINESYIDKHMMINMGKYEKCDNIINAKGFNLYNNLNSKCEDYELYKGMGYNDKYVKTKRELLLSKNKFLYYFCYNSKSTKEIEQTFVKEPVKCVLVRTYKRKYTDGIDLDNSQNIRIYKISQ